MTTLTAGRTYRVADAAERLGVDPKTVWWWTSRWGRDHRRDWLTGVDVMVLRAILVLTGGVGGAYTDGGRLRQAEAMIRSDPRRWLLVAGDIVQTYHHAETAALAWAGSGQPCGQVIDLWSVPA